MPSDLSNLEKTQLHFEALAESASSLNKASDELTKVVGNLDEALKKLNVGLTVWVNFASRGDDEEPWLYDEDQIGYCKVNGKWGFALQHVWGDNRDGDGGSEGPWLFNDAPREMRLKSVEKLPDVIGELAKAAFETTRRVQEKTAQVRALAGAIEQIANPDKKGVRPPAPPAPLSRTPQRPPAPPAPPGANPERGALQPTSVQELLTKAKEGAK
jgi:hypothetical protein